MKKGRKDHSAFALVNFDDHKHVLTVSVKSIEFKYVNVILRMPKINCMQGGI